MELNIRGQSVPIDFRIVSVFSFVFAAWSAFTRKLTNLSNDNSWPMIIIVNINVVHSVVFSGALKPVV